MLDFGMSQPSDCSLVGLLPKLSFSEIQRIPETYRRIQRLGQLLKIANCLHAHISSWRSCTSRYRTQCEKKACKVAWSSAVFGLLFCSIECWCQEICHGTILVD